jgi:uncharacterized membrane protein (DUF373 family)
MAIARKVIILDYSKISAEYVWATAGVVLAMSIAYWMVHKFGPSEFSFRRKYGMKNHEHAVDPEIIKSENEAE